MIERNTGIIISVFSWAGVFLILGGMCFNSLVAALAGFASMCIGIGIAIYKEFGFNLFKRKK